MSATKVKKVVAKAPSDDEGPPPDDDEVVVPVKKVVKKVVAAPPADEAAPPVKKVVKKVVKPAPVDDDDAPPPDDDVPKKVVVKKVVKKEEPAPNGGGIAAAAAAAAAAKAKPKAAAAASPEKPAAAAAASASPKPKVAAAGTTATKTVAKPAAAAAAASPAAKPAAAKPAAAKTSSIDDSAGAPKGVAALQAALKKGLGVSDDAAPKKTSAAAGGPLKPAAKGGKKEIRFSANKDTILTLLDSLNTKTKFTKMVEYSLECLKNLAVSVVDVQEMLELGVLEGINKVMALNKDNEAIQRLVNETLIAFTRRDNPELTKPIAAQISAKQLCYSLANHKDPKTVKGTVELTLSLLKDNKEFAAQMVKEGGVHAISRLLKDPNFQGNESIMSAAIAVLEHLCDISADVVQDAWEADCLEGIISALKRFPKNRRLVEAALKLLPRFALLGPDAIKRMRDLGVIDIIVNAVEFHPDSEVVLTLGGMCLASLSDASDLEMAMRDMLSDNPLKRAAAFGKIASLLLVDGNIDFLLEKDGLRFLIKAMKAALKGGLDANAKKIISAGARALGRMATDDERIYKIMQEGGVKLLISIMTLCPDDEDLSCSAMAGLARMATRKENAQFFADSGAIEAALAVLHAQPESIRVATNFIRFISALGMHKKVLRKMIGLGVLTALSGVITKFADDPEMATEVLRCLSNWASKAENVEAMLEAGIVGQIKVLLEKHCENASIVTLCLQLIQQLCEVSDAAHDSLANDGTIEVIKMVMDKNAESPSLVDMCKETIAIVLGGNNSALAVDELLQFTKGLLASLKPGKGGKRADYDPEAAAKLLESVKSVAALLQEALDNNDEAALEKLLAAGLDQALVDALRAAAAMLASNGGEDSAEALEAMRTAIEALKSLIERDPNGATAIATANSMVDLYRSVVAAPDNEELAETVTQFGLYLAQIGDTTRVIMQKTGCVPVIVEVMRAHSERPTVVSSCVLTLDVLVDSPDYVSQLTGTDCIESLVECLELLEDDPDALAAVLRLLQSCSYDFASAQAVYEANVLNAVKPVCVKHMENSAVMQEVVSLISKLTKFHDLSKALLEAEMLKPIVKLLRANHTNEQLVEQTLVLLEKISHDKETKKALAVKKMQAPELVNWLMEAYPDNARICKYGKLLVKTLTAPTEEEVAAALEKQKRLLQKQAAEKQRLYEESLKVPDELNDEDVDELFEKLQNLEGKDLIKLLKSLLQAVDDPDNAQLLLQRGGMQQLFDLMQKHQDDDEVTALAGQIYMKLLAAAGTTAEISTDSAHAMGRLIAQGSRTDADALRDAITLLSNTDITEEILMGLLQGAPWEQLMHILMTSKDPLLLAVVAKLLAKMSNHEAALNCLSKLADLRELIATMRRNMQNAEFMKYAVYLLSNLANNDELKDMIGVEGGIQVILEVVEMYMDDQGLVDNATYALNNLSQDNEVNCSFIMACSGITTICRALEAHPTAASLLEQCIGALCNLCTSNDTNKDAVVAEDAPKVISDVMMGNSDQLDMLSTCMRCLGHLCNDNNNCTAVAKSGAIQAIVSAMTSCSGEPDEVTELKLLGIRVLSNMAAFNLDAVMPIFNVEGAVEILCRTVEENLDNIEMEKAALLCISNVCQSVANAKAVIKLDIVEAIVTVMDNLGYDEDLVAQACQALMTISLCHEKFKKIMDSGAVNATLLGVRTHITNKLVIKYGLGVIGNLCFDEPSADTVAKDGTITLCLTLTKERLDDPEIIADAFICLSGLVRSATNAMTMSEMAMNAVEECMTQHPEEVDMITACFAFLANLCMHKSAAEAVIDTELIPEVLRSFTVHGEEISLLITGLKAIENTAFASKEVRDFLKKEGVIDACQALLDANMGEPELVRACKACMAAVNRENIEISDLKAINLGKTIKISAKEKQAEAEKKLEMPKLKEASRNLLLGGHLMDKHQTAAPPHARHVFVSADFKFICWKHPKKKLEEENRIKIAHIVSVDTGRCTPALQRKKIGGKFYAKEECCFAVIGQKGKRNVELEVESEEVRDKWVGALNDLIEWRKQCKLVASKFGNF